MREPRDLPAHLDALTGSGTACLAATPRPRARRRRRPGPAAGPPRPVDRVENWLDGRARPRPDRATRRRFSGPGPWLAVLRSGRRGRRVCAVAYGLPSTSPGTRSAGRRRSPTSRRAMSWPRPTSPCGPARRDAAADGGARGRDRDRPRGRGGDRARSMGDRGRRPRAGGRPLPLGAGTFTNLHRLWPDLMLVQTEALEELGYSPPATTTRRNIVTRGIDLNALVGRRFTGRRGRVHRPPAVRAVRPPRSDSPPRDAAPARAPRRGCARMCSRGGTIRVGDAVSRCGTELPSTS